MTTKDIVFITGANTGIGYQAVKSLLQSPKPYHILLGSRSLLKGEAAVAKLAEETDNGHSTVEAVEIDITDDDSIQRAFQFVWDKFGRVDVLVNNAGACFDTTFDNDGKNFRNVFNETYNVNVAGTQVFTYVFAPLLLKSSSPRLLFNTSGRSSLAKEAAHEQVPKFAPGWPKQSDSAWLAQGYRSSKAALNMIMLTWQTVLKEDNVKVWCINPGLLATNLGGSKSRLEKMGAADPSIGGNLIRQAIEGERDADMGKVVCRNGGVQAW
ncbi:hypothetical protein G7Z17_g2971 [Cylindrodendrum hubeiense]|uniref:Short chain dehydrogenase n=1 Tax=Cylindrodendrum hubeiense TaxID=595255 RepID=A0A9P5LE03_9HYPO|nr:hypothetical protein G7Z17_g2971 [Cylindrodendrum hubeiense]